MMQHPAIALPAFLFPMATCLLPLAFGQESAPPIMKEHIVGRFRIIAIDDENTVNGCFISADFVRRAVHSMMSAVGVPVVVPPEPLSIVVFENAQLMAAELRRVGLHSNPVNAFYDQETNAVYLAPIRDPASQCGSSEISPGYAECARRLSDSDMLTKRHELAHLFMYNMGAFTRGAQYPAWITEGFACMFEVNPWEISHHVDHNVPTNRFRLDDVGNTNSMLRIRAVTTNLRPWEARPETAARHYAQSWALAHFLYHRHRKEFGAYLRGLSLRKSGESRTADEELAEFEAAFGPVDESLERRWRDYVSELIDRAKSDPSRPGAPG